MKKKLFNNEFFSLSVILFLITFSVALLLSIVNYITEPKIKAQNQKDLNESMMLVLPQAKDFEIVDLSCFSFSTDVEIVSAYKGLDGDKVVGYCVEVKPNGYSDVIDLVVGFNTKNEITKTKIISISDTVGIGTQVENDEFNSQFNNKVGPFSLVKGKDLVSDGEVLLISGATYSSTGYANGVNAACEVVLKISEGEGLVNE